MYDEPGLGGSSRDSSRAEDSDMLSVRAIRAELVSASVVASGNLRFTRFARYEDGPYLWTEWMMPLGIKKSSLVSQGMKLGLDKGRVSAK